jgi:transcriptional regulator with XRE-family HTH domain
VLSGADILRIARRRAGLSQRQLAERMEVPPATISRWESGQNRPSFERLGAAVAACGLELSTALTRADGSYAFQIYDQLGRSPAERVTAMLPPEPFDPLAELRRLAEADVPFIVIGGVADALHGSPLMLGWRELAICAPPDAEAAIAALFTEAGNADEWRAPRFELPSGGVLELWAEPPGTHGYDDLARDAETVELAIELAVKVASLLDLIRMADANFNWRSGVAALKATLAMSRGGSIHPAYVT